MCDIVGGCSGIWQRSCIGRTCKSFRPVRVMALAVDWNPLVVVDKYLNNNKTSIVKVDFIPA